MKKPNIIIVDDHQIFRQGIISILSIENIGSVIGEASNGEDFIELLSTLKPDLVLMDIDMPGMNGLEATERALSIFPDIKIIAFTLFGDEEYFIQMIKLGAWGYVLKSSSFSELEKAILNIMNGEKYFCNNQFTRSSNKIENKHLKVLSGNKKKSKNKNDSLDLFPLWD